MTSTRLRPEERDWKPLVASQPLVGSTFGDTPAFLHKLFATTWLAAPVPAALVLAAPVLAAPVLAALALVAPVVWEMVALEVATPVQAGPSVCDEDENPAGSAVAISKAVSDCMQLKMLAASSCGDETGRLATG